MISELDIIVRLLISAALGAVIGFERERQGQPAGLRTHIILVIGAALAMMLSINIAAPNNDPGRLAAQVISGIGFLGAGAILRYGPNVKGLTTATSLWTMAIVGLAVGMGEYLAGVGATALLLAVLVLLNLFEKRFINPISTITLTVIAEDRSGLVEDLKKVALSQARSMSSISLRKNLKRRRTQVVMVLRVRGDSTHEKLMDLISEVRGVKAFKIE